MMRKYDWPTREQSAEQQRTLYIEEAFDIGDHVSKRLSDYATAEEIAAAISPGRVVARLRAPAA
jgi:hypothetical protein